MDKVIFIVLMVVAVVGLVVMYKRGKKVQDIVKAVDKGKDKVMGEVTMAEAGVKDEVKKVEDKIKGEEVKK